MRPRRHDRRFKNGREAAANGLLDRRAFLQGGVEALATGAFMAYAEWVKMPNRDNFIPVYPWKSKVP
jgi:hypothetical protein